MKQPRVRRSHQQGIAAILILVMVGLSLTATMLGSAHYLRSSQEQHTALHAQSIAQARAWTAAEALRRYLEAVAQAGEWDSLVASLALPAPISMGLNGVGEAHVIQVDTGAIPPRLTARLTARAAEASRAEASSVLEVVYSVVPGVAGSNDNVITFNRDLRLGGSITVQAEADRDYQLNVRGNLLTDGNSITGISIIRATESIDIGSGSSFDELHANGDIRLSGSVSGQQNLLARGNICLSGGASAMGQVRANGSVIGDGGVRFGAISSLGSNDGAGPELCEPPSLAVDNSGKPYGVDLRGNSSADSVRSKASVRVNSGSIGNLLSEGDLVDTNWGGSVHGQIGGQLLPTHNNPDLPASIQVSPGLVVPVSPVPPVSLSTIEFNAYDLRQDANYAFWADSSGYRMVTVKDVNGVEDRDYYLGNYPSGPNHLDRLCTALAPGSSPSDPRCSTPPAKEQSIPVCKGHSEWNGCFAYRANEQQWELNGASMAQGIVWFEGNLQLGNGDYYATFIATENIITGAQHKTTAPNYAGYSRRSGLQHGMCTDLVFPEYYPTQLCQGSSYNHAAAGGLGNYALLAGSCDQAFPAECRYQGGNISTGVSSVIRGAIKAGNEFRSGGSSTIHGYITALALGEEQDNSSMGGSTNIILTNLPEGYDPSGGSEGSAESVIPPKNHGAHK